MKRKLFKTMNVFMVFAMVVSMLQLNTHTAQAATNAPGSLKMGTAVNNGINVNGTYFPTLYLSNQIPVYCLDAKRPSPPNNVTVNASGKLDPRFPMLLRTFSTLSLSGHPRYYVEQVAIRWLTDRINGVSDSASGQLTANFKGYNHTYVKEAKRLVDAVMSKPIPTNTVSIERTTSSWTLTSSGEYYDSGPISVSATGNMTQFRVSSRNAPTGMRIVTLDNLPSQTYPYPEHTQFKLLVPVSAVSSNDINFEINVTGTYETDVMYKYGYNSNYQPITPKTIYTETETETSSFLPINVPAKKYTASFDANGGEEVYTTITKAQGQPLGTLPTTQREHYEFEGWYTSPVGGNLISSSTTMPNHDVTYYAHWNPILYTYAVDYYFDDVWDKNYSYFDYAEYGITVSLIPRQSIVKDGNNYVLVSTDHSTVIQGTVPEDNVIIVKYELDNTGPNGEPDGIPDKNQYSITYDKNSASASGTTIDTNIYSAGANVTVKNSNFINSGYTFVGWNTKANGSGTSYSPGSTISMMEGGMTLYAQWEKEAPTLYNYRIEYYYNGQIDSAETIIGSGLYGELISVNPESSKLKGTDNYTLISQNHSITLTEGENVIRVEYELDNNGPEGTPDAIPDRIEYPIFYDKNSETATGSVVDSNIYPVGYNVTVKENEFTNPGMIFNAWAETPNELETFIFPGSTIAMKEGGITLYASWYLIPPTPKQEYRVEFYFDGVIFDGYTEINTAEVGELIEYSPSQSLYHDDKDWVLVSTDHKLVVGTETEANVIKVEYELDMNGPDGSSDLIPDKDEYTITYDKNVVEAPEVYTDPHLYPVGYDVSLMDNSFIYENHVFKEWNTSPDGSGISYNGGDSIKMIEGGITLYAIWENNVPKPSPVIQSWKNNADTDFHNELYRNKITEVYFTDYAKVPENAVEAWDISEKANESVMAWVVADSNNPDCYILYIGGDNGVIANANSSNMFRNFPVLTKVDFASNFDTSTTNNLSYLFRDCPMLVSINLTGIDTSNVVFMDEMFKGNSQLETIIGIETLNTQSLESMASIFEGCSSLVSLDLSQWDVSNVGDKGYAFYNMFALTDLNISTWMTSSLYNASNMFAGCYNLEILDLSHFDMSNVEYADAMFAGDESLPTMKLKKIIGLENFDTSSIIDSTRMFAFCSELSGEMTFSNAMAESYLEMFFNACITGDGFTLHYTADSEFVVDEIIADTYPSEIVIKGTEKVL